MTISKTEFPQKLYEKSYTKLDFMEKPQSENHIVWILFEISRCLHYFVQPLYILFPFLITVFALSVTNGANS